MLKSGKKKDDRCNNRSFSEFHDYEEKWKALTKTVMGFNFRCRHLWNAKPGRSWKRLGYKESVIIDNITNYNKIKNAEWHSPASELSKKCGSKENYWTKLNLAGWNRKRNGNWSNLNNFDIV